MDKIEGLIPCYNKAQTIYVCAPDKSSGKRAQHIHIKYDSVGFIPPLDELMKKGEGVIFHVPSRFKTLILEAVDHTAI